MKKKSLLATIAAMTIAAVGIGTVSTFAWYTASAAVSTTAATDSATLSTAVYSGGLGSVRFNVALDNTEYENIQLSYNDSGTAKTGYVANGVAYTVAAVDGCFAVATVTVTAELVDGVGGMTLAQALDSLYDAGTTSINIYAKAAGYAVCNWDADGTLSSSERNTLVAKSNANSANTTIALANGGGTDEWTLYLGLAVHTKNTNTTLDTESDHESDGITVKSVEAIA